jgi:hypothetical protein
VMSNPSFPALPRIQNKVIEQSSIGTSRAHLCDVSITYWPLGGCAGATAQVKRAPFPYAAHATSDLAELFRLNGLKSDSEKRCNV